MKKIIILILSILSINSIILAEESEKESLSNKESLSSSSNESYLSDLFGVEVEETEETKGIQMATVQTASGNELHGNFVQAAELSRHINTEDKYIDVLTLTLAEGEVRRNSWKNWKVWYKVSQEYKMNLGNDGEDTEFQTIHDGKVNVEINPRWETGYGKGQYGNEFGFFSTEDGTKLKVRPFVTYKLTPEIELSQTVALQYQANFASDDALWLMLEPSYSQEVTALGPMSRLWIRPYLEYKWTFDEDNTETDEQYKGKVTEEFYLFCLKAHYWKGFKNGLGINLLGEFLGYANTDRKISGTSKEEIYTKYIITATKEWKGNVIFGEANYRPVQFKDTSSDGKVKDVNDVFLKIGLNRNF